MGLSSISVKTISTLTLLLSLTAAPLFAGGSVIPEARVIDLSKVKKKKPFFELMRTEVIQMQDEDYVDNNGTVIFVDSKTFRERIGDSFTHLPALEMQINGGAKALDSVMDELAKGPAIPHEKLWQTVMGIFEKRNLANHGNPNHLVGSLLPIMQIASGEGTAIRLDKNTVIYSVGYKQGTGGQNLMQDTKDKDSGRSYARSLDRGIYDPSDNDYLTELGIYASQADKAELTKFYTAYFKFLLTSDASGISTLSPMGQTVFADLAAIYWAEARRHWMSGLKKFPWENAITEVTLGAAFTTADAGFTIVADSADSSSARRVVEANTLAPGKRLKAFFAVGPSGHSGIDGFNLMVRHVLLEKIAAAMADLEPDLVKDLQTQIEKENSSSPYVDLMKWINNKTTQDSVTRRADKVVSAVTKYAVRTREKAHEIKEFALSLCQKGLKDLAESRVGQTRRVASSK